MTKTDQDLDAALRAEEQELLRQIAGEPGYFSQLSGAFAGSTGWISSVLMAAQIVLFAAAVWCGWQFYGASDALTALHWGLPAMTFALMALMLKLAIWPVIQANRVLRAVKHLELQLARTAL
jgi:hypothetical protein